MVSKKNNVSDPSKLTSNALAPIADGKTVLKPSQLSASQNAPVQPKASHQKVEENDGSTVFKPSAASKRSSSNSNNGASNKASNNNSSNNNSSNNNASNNNASNNNASNNNASNSSNNSSNNSSSSNNTSNNADPVQASVDKAKAKGLKKIQANKHAGQQVAALTQIRQSIVKQDSSQGFVKAKKAADKALANNSIVLNNRFVLEETLGAGGMGTVYKAKDLRKVEADDRKPYVAVKVLNDDFKDHPDAFVTLQREASRSHILSHPKIVTVHDFDRDDDVIYMTMELMEGQPLDTTMKQFRSQGMPSEDAMSIISDICEALHFAHDKDIIHSDLKPGNIFLTADGAKILDFGIARLTSVNDDFDSGALGALTPTYASLEMFTNEAPAAGDDLYAIAIIAYELLSGQHPFNRTPADEAQAKGMTPKKIPGLSKRQWQALESALKFKRDERTQNVELFRHEFFEKKKFPIFKVTSIILLLVSSALAYLFLLAPNEVDTHIQQAVDRGNKCFQQKQFACAVESFETVLTLQPDHQQAQQRLEHAQQSYTQQRIQDLVQQASLCLNEQKDVVCATAKLRELDALATDGNEANDVQRAITLFQRKAKIADIMGVAENCYQEKDYHCTIEKADEVLAIDHQYFEAQTLKKEVLGILENRRSQKAQLDQQYSSAITSGKKCLNKQKFDCAAKYFSQASELKPTEADAKTLHQNALFSKQQKENAYSKANKLIGKAQVCLDKKNYTCAISNAESALEFVPGYSKAVALKKQANEEQQEVKKSFSIE